MPVVLLVHAALIHPTSVNAVQQKKAHAMYNIVGNFEILECELIE